MKEIFISKSLIAKIALVLVVIILLEFTISSKPVQAASLGGTLLNPIVNLVVYLADGAIQILQSALTTIDQTFTYIDITKEKKSWIAAIVAVIVGIVLVVGSVIAIVYTAGGAAPAIVSTIASMGGSLIGAGALSATAGGIYLATYPQFGSKIDAVVFGNSFVYMQIYITPETILKNQIQLFNVNFFDRGISNETDSTASLASTLRTIVSQVYHTIRDISLVAMLIVIIYVAIRLLMALTPKEKSRYKESIVNCVVGFLLILFMHYMMSISVSILEQITNSIAISNSVYDIEEDEDAVDSYIRHHPEVLTQTVSGVSLTIEGEELYKKVIDEDSGESLYPGIMPTDENEVMVQASNFTEQARYMSQKLYELNDDDETVETWEHIGWSFVYIMLVVLTVSFVFMYGKRTLYMAALTMFAPIIGVLYPINRVNGSRSHALNLWFKEYFGNLIIQPFHLLLYTIFIGSAMSMAVNNPVYVIIAIMGLMFVEQLLKDILGIQDTRIGGLAKSLQDTTRAIKTTEKAAVSVAKTVGRTAVRGTNAIGRLTTKGIEKIASSKDAEDNSEEGSENNRQIREQRNPIPSSGDGGNNLPPPTASGQSPVELEDESDKDVIEKDRKDKQELGQVARFDETKKTLKDRDKLEEGIKDEEDAKRLQGRLPNETLDSTEYNKIDKRTQSLLKDKSQLEEAIEKEEIAGRGNSDIVKEYRKDLQAVNTELDSIGYNEKRDDNKIATPEWMDSDIVSMLKSDSGIYIGGNEGKVFYQRADNDKIIDMITLDRPNAGEQLAMAAGNESSASTMNIQNIEEPRTARSTDIEMENRRRSTSSASTASNSKSTSYNFSDNSRIVQGGNDSNNFETSSTIREGYRTVDGGLDKNGNPKPINNIENVNLGETQGSTIDVGSNNVRTNNSQNANVTRTRRTNHIQSNGNSGNSQTNINSSSGGDTTTADNTQNSSSGGDTTTTNNTQNSSSGRDTTTTNNTQNSSSTEEQTSTETNNSDTGNSAVNKQHDNRSNSGEKLARGIQKGMDVAGTITDRTTSVVGTAVEGVIDTALNAVSGNVGATANTVIGTATGVIGTATGAPRRASSSETSSSNKSTKSSKQPNQNVQTIMKDAGLSEEEAKSIEVACKKFRINDDRNMAEVGKVWKKTSEADKSKIFELAQILIEVKRDGGNIQQAEKTLDNARVGSNTKELLLKMYKNLHG